jgi:GNAT superfamily N-acetyltransferase
MNIRVERFKPEYQDKVIEIITTIQQKEFNLPITSEDQPDLMAIDDFYDGFLVALHDGVPIGTIAYKCLEDYAILRKMFVEEGFRGPDYGVAQKLLEGVENEIAARGITKIYLGMTRFFKAAHRFYERNNYTEIPRDSLPIHFPVMTVDTKFYSKSL